jgi:PAS domain S-box-containing protein
MTVLNKKHRLPRRRIAERQVAGALALAQGENPRFTLLRDRFPALAVETANHAFVATDLRGRITNWNGAAETLFGWSSEEMLDGDLAELLIAERDREVLRTGLRRFLHTRSSQVIGKPIELAAQSREGQEIPVEISIWPTTIKGEVTFQAFLRDISDQKVHAQAEQHETTLANLLQTITAAANKATSPEEAVKLCLKYVCQQGGFQLAHLYLADKATMELTCTEVWHDSDPGRFVEFRKVSESISDWRALSIPGLVLSERKSQWFEVFTDARRLPNFVRFAPAQRAGIRSAFAFPLMAGNHILGVLEFFSTDLLPCDEKLMNIAGQIGAQIGYVIMRERLDASLREAKEIAEKATQAKSAFLASMSHEIRTPMNAILGMAELLAESPLNPEQTRYVEVFQQAGASLLALINDILDLSKIESGNFILENIAFNLRDVCERAINLVRPGTAAKEITLEARFDPEVPMAVLGDPTRLQQVLLNLLGNAKKFTERGGGIVLTVGPHRSRQVGQVEFEVSDTGIGIAPDKLNTIFVDFQQGDSSTTRKYGGTGLGLGISKRIVELMRGNISVESTLGKGSTFRFSATFEASELPDAQQSAALEDLRGKRLLVVDDDSTNRLIFCKTLQSCGFKIMAVANASQASTELREASQNRKPFSAVLLDVNMTSADGFQVAAQVRAAAPDVPILMLTSDNGAGETAKFEALGISHYAVKPVPRAELLRSIAAAVRGKNPSKSQALGNAAPAARKTGVEHDGLSILVAEDSSANRFLVEAYLRRSAHRLTFVENGREALDLVRQRSFDLVLMDIQMPIMDGLSATRLIREWELAEKRPPTPILALTANALASDMEAAYEAGCDKHLSKPLSKQRLLSALDEYSPALLAEKEEPVSVFVDVPEGLEELVPIYLAELRKDSATLLTLLDKADFSGIRRIGHNLKGTGTSYGFEKVSHLGELMGTAAKNEDLARLATTLQELAQYLNSVQVRAIDSPVLPPRSS